MKKLRIILQSKYLYIFIFFITFIYCFIILKFNIYKTNYNELSNDFEGIITNIKYSANYNTLEIKNKEKVIVYDYNKDKKYKIGYKVRVSGEFVKPNTNSNFYLFNYNNYLKSKKIYWSINVKQIEIIKKDINIFYKIKNIIINRINKIGNPYLKAFIMGDTSSIKKNVISSYQSNGISHLFAVSGMHVSLISLVIISILNYFKKSNINYFIVFLILIFYIFLTNYSKSVIRASLFYTLLSLNKLFKLNISNIKIFIFITLIILLKNPYNIYNNAFLFSYTITLFLILFGSLINTHKSYLKKLLITSFISFLAGLPILINSYFNVNLLSIFLNIIFVPFVSLIIFPLSILTFFLPILNDILKIFITILEQLSLYIDKINIFNLTMHHLNIIGIFIYYLIIIIVLNNFKTGGYHKIWLLVILLIIHNNYRYLDFNAYLIMLDVMQGDSNLIILPNNKGNILIDTGGIFGNDLTGNTLIPVLKSNGIKQIDYLILTHGDFDHMGESINLVENFKVEKVIFNNDDYNNLELKLIEVLKRKNIKYYKDVEQLNVNNNNIYFLNTKQYDNENDNSNVIYFDYNNYKFLFMGDSGVEKERDILEKYNIKDIDFLKIGHHGSDTSSSKKFITSINPKYSLISVGKNNRYGHPKESVLEILSNSKIYRTDINGSIEIMVNKKDYKIKTCLH